jgi:hypothetical protein
MNDIARIKANVELMASKGAPPQHIDDYLASEGLSRDQFRNRLAGYEDAQRLTGVPTKYSAGSGLANLIDLPGRGLTAAYNLEQMAKGVITGRPQDYPTASPDTLDFANPAFRKAGLIDDAYAPANKAERIMDFGTQALTGGGVNPAAVVRNGARGMVKPIIRDVGAAIGSGIGAGIGANIGDDIAVTGNGSADNAIKIGLSGIGGMLGGGAIASRGTAGDRVAAATKGVSPEQWAEADKIARLAAQLQNPVTGYEALQKVTGLNPKMQTQQRIVEQSDAAAKGLTQILQNRPKANAAAVENAISTIAPPSTQPDTLAGKLQTASQGAITAARQKGNQTAAPYYANSSNNPANRVPSQTWNSLIGDDGVMAALSAVKKDPYAGLQGAQEGSMSWLDQAKKYLDGQISVARQNGDNFAASQMSAARDKIVAAADTAFPDYAKARAIIAKNMQENVVPMEQGQIGKLSRSDDFKAQSASLLPDAPADVTPSVVRQTASTIGAQDPDIVSQFLAQDLRRKFNEANQQNIGGENVLGGSKFAANIAGNPEQEANLLTAIDASGAPTQPFKDVLTVFRAQGMKPPVNSATSANLAEGGAMAGKKLVDLLMNPLDTVRASAQNWRNGWAANDLAKALASGGDSVARLEELARLNGTFDPMKQQMLINALLAPQATQ